MLYGYARVSTKGQSLKDQMDLIKSAGVENKNLFHEKFTGTKTTRPQFTKLLDTLKTGDTLVVAKLDRLARNLREALNAIYDIREKGVTIKVLNPNMTVTTDMGGKIMYQTLLMIADIERDMIVSRTEEGKAYAKAHNPNYREGRKSRMQGKNKDRYQLLFEYRQNHTAKQTAEAFNVSMRTVFNVCKAIKESE